MNKYQKEYSLLYQSVQSPMIRSYKTGLDKVEESDELHEFNRKSSMGKLPSNNTTNIYKTIENRGSSFSKKTTLLSSGANILNSPNKSQIFSSILS